MKLFFIISFKVLCYCAVCSLTLDLSPVTTSASSMKRGHLEMMQLVECFFFNNKLSKYYENQIFIPTNSVAGICNVERISQL